MIRNFQTTIILLTIIMLGFCTYFAFSIINRSTEPTVTLRTILGNPEFATNYKIQGKYTLAFKKESFRFAEQSGYFSYHIAQNQTEFPYRLQTLQEKADFKNMFNHSSLYRKVNEINHNNTSNIAESKQWMAIAELIDENTHLQFHLQNRETNKINSFKIPVSKAQYNLQSLDALYIDEQFIYIMTSYLPAHEEMYVTTKIFKIAIETEQIVDSVDLFEIPRNLDIIKSTSTRNPFSLSYLTTDPINPRSSHAEKRYASRYITVVTSSKGVFQGIKKVDFKNMTVSELQTNKIPSNSESLSSIVQIYGKQAYFYTHAHLFVFDLETDQLLYDFPVPKIDALSPHRIKINNDTVAILGIANQHIELHIYETKTSKLLYQGRLEIEHKKFDYRILGGDFFLDLI